MNVYIFGENYAGQQDWYYTAAKLSKPRWIQWGTRKRLVFMAAAAEMYKIDRMGFGYIMPLWEMIKAIRNHDLYFSRTAAEAEARRRWQERFGG
ncbi:MAG: hypothetical protein RR998_08415 [Oscillospiraceae bacterium]